MKKTFLAFAFAATLATVGCKKEDNTPEPTPVTTETLSGSYKLVSVKAQVAGSSSETDITTSYFDACEIDDVTTLKTDLTYTVVDAGAQCSPSGGYAGTWSVSNSTTVIMDGESFTVKSWDGKNLVLSQTGDYNGISATITTTITKQ